MSYGMCSNPNELLESRYSIRDWPGLLCGVGPSARSSPRPISSESSGRPENDCLSQAVPKSFTAINEDTARQRSQSRTHCPHTDETGSLARRQAQRVRAVKEDFA